MHYFDSCINVLISRAKKDSDIFCYACDTYFFFNQLILIGFLAEKLPQKLLYFHSESPMNDLRPKGVKATKGQLVVKTTTETKH